MALRPLYSKLLFALGLGSLFCLNTAWAAFQEPLLINQIVIDPRNPSILYAAARPQGVLKSTDRGGSWRPVRRGLMNTSVYYIIVNPKNTQILYSATFGGGVYKSENGGDDWFEVNRGLGNTNIHALALNPLQPDRLLVSTSTGELFKSDDAGRSWNPFNEGLPIFPGDVISTLLIFPKDPGGFYLAQGGLFMRPFSSPAWRAVEGNLHDDIITAMAHDSSGRAFYAGTINHGLFKASLGPDAASAEPMTVRSPLHWKPVGGPFQKQQIRFIAMEPGRPAAMYASVVSHGLFKSSDGGSSWEAINSGFPELEVESLAIDPENPKFLYAGTHNDGLFTSRDGGKTWNPPSKIEVEPLKQIIASLSGPSPADQPRPPQDAPPPFFFKCNKCHGWTDALLNQKATYWRVSPNQRDWQPTVRRMSPGAGLTAGEQEAVIRFLTAYGQQRSGAPER
ncbi:MAG TPA: hypothetical protein VLY20_01665 [Nitrospiria bacterium]|nr:hypothetical protein [Nitrospiria bacterium]